MSPSPASRRSSPDARLLGRGPARARSEILPGPRQCPSEFRGAAARRIPAGRLPRDGAPDRSTGAAGHGGGRTRARCRFRFLPPRWLGGVGPPARPGSGAGREQPSGARGAGPRRTARAYRRAGGLVHGRLRLPHRPRIVGGDRRGGVLRDRGGRRGSGRRRGLRVGAPARPPRLPRAGGRALLPEQRGDRGAAAARRGRGAGRRAGYRQPPRQRHPRHLLGPPGRAVRVRPRRSGRVLPVVRGLRARDGWGGGMP